MNQLGTEDLVRSGKLVWIGRACRAARLQHGTVSSVELVMCRTQCIIILNLFSFPEFISFSQGACATNNFLARNLGAILDNRNKKFIMESAYAKVCCICSCSTKYRCISCQISLCNRCSIAELDETNAGWIPGQQVGYCTDCHHAAINVVDEQQEDERSTPTNPSGRQKSARKMSSPCGSASVRYGCILF